MEFLGYERPDGSAGIRNYVAVISSGRCANEMAATIADAVPGAVPVIHTHVCVRFKDDNEKALRVLSGIGSSPNVAAAVVVGVGCENPSPAIIAGEIAKSKKPVKVLTIMESDGFQSFMDEGLATTRSMVAEASRLQRKPFPLSYLTLGVKCGGSSAVSGIAGNAATGKVFDRLIAEGGTAIFSETTEVIGADHLLAKRAVNETVANKFREMVERQEAIIKASGEDIRGTQPTRGNISEGLTTIEDKSLGAMAKSGTSPIQGVLEYAEKPPGKGLYFMDGTAMTSELISSEAAAGAHIHIYNVGGGVSSSFRCAPGWMGDIPFIPQISVVSRQSKPRDSQEKDFFDIYADTVVEGTESVDEVADRFFDEVIAVASGKLTKREMRRGYREPIVLYSTGPIL
ncbi:MAG: UxaA family hydrolase [Dehalococcoidia bacterium]|nr:UxaA family hydrolase [Dehalococcoidia bacterium]